MQDNSSLALPCNPDVHSKPASPNSSSVVPPGAFAVAFGNPANAGYLYGLTMLVDLHVQAAEKASENASSYTQGSKDRLVESLGTQKAESWSSKVKDSLHIYTETLTPLKFLEGAESFLDSVGVNSSAEISINEQSAQDSSRLDLHDAVGACKKHLQTDETSIRTMEISSTGKNDEFAILLDFFYTKKHRYDQAPVCLEVRAMSSELGPRKAESFSDYRTRMNAIDTDVHKRAKIYEAIDAQKKALYSDYAHHLAEAFPGVRLRLYEGATPGGA
jgi:hypothetical protein